VVSQLRTSPIDGASTAMVSWVTAPPCHDRHQRPWRRNRAATVISRRHALGLTLGLSLLSACNDSSVHPEAHDVATVRVTPAVAGDSMKPAIKVELRDGGGSRVTDAEVPVTLALGANPGGATLGGTLTVTSAAGVATFRGVWLDKAAGGYTLTASTVGVAPVT